MFALRHTALPLLLAGVLLTACGPQYKDDSKVLATVNGDDITQKDFDSFVEMTRQHPAALDEQARKALLDQLIDRVLLSQAGRRLNLESAPDVHFGVKREFEKQIIRQYLLTAILKPAYESKVMAMPRQEYKLRHVLVKTEAEANQLVERLKKGTNFETLAKTKSQDAGTAKQGGDLGWVSPLSGLDPRLSEAIKPLGKGEMTAPVQSQYGWHLIRVEDTRPLEIPDFDSALVDPRMGSFLAQLQEETLPQIQSTIEELKTKAKIVKQEN